MTQKNTTFSFCSSQFIWQIILHFLQSFFTFFSFMYNSKNKSFSSRFYIRHLQVQCVTCPSYKVHLYFFYRSRLFHDTNSRGQIKEKMIQGHRIRSVTSQYHHPITPSPRGAASSPTPTISMHKTMFFSMKAILGPIEN